MTTREPSVPPCPHRPPCPGCPHYGEIGAPAASMATLTDLARSHGLGPISLVSGPPTGWRHRARLAVRGRSNSPKIGLFQRNSHRIVDIPRCVVHHPLINRVVAQLKNAIRATAMEPYAEMPHKGVLRYVEIAVDAAGESAFVVLVINGRDAEIARPVAEHLRRHLGGCLRGVFANLHTERSNAVMGAHTVKLMGDDDLVDVLDGARVFVPATAFSQANPGVFAKIREDLHAWVPNDKHVVEFYAGVGALGLGLAARSASITFNEISPAALVGLERGIAELPELERAKVEIAKGAAAAAVDRVARADIVLADPPRKGLDRELVEALTATPPDLFVLIACGFDSFLRDQRALLSSGVFTLADLRVYDLFPFSEHLEVMGVFSRRD